MEGAPPGSEDQTRSTARDRPQRQQDQAEPPCRNRARLFVGNCGAGGSCQRYDLATREARLETPAPKIGAAEIERVSELDEHVELHQEPEVVLSPLVVNDILYGNEGPT